MLSRFIFLGLFKILNFTVLKSCNSKTSPLNSLLNSYDVCISESLKVDYKQTAAILSAISKSFVTWAAISIQSLIQTKDINRRGENCQQFPQTKEIQYKKENNYLMQDFLKFICLELVIPYLRTRCLQFTLEKINGNRSFPPVLISLHTIMQSN